MWMRYLSGKKKTYTKIMFDFANFQKYYFLQMFLPYQIEYFFIFK